MTKLSNLKSWESFGLPEEKVKKEPKKSEVIEEEDEDVADNKTSKEGDAPKKEEPKKEDFDEKELEKIYSFLASMSKDADVRDTAHKLGVYLKNFSSTDTAKLEEFLKKKEDSK